jgi:hypothetical protein
MPGKRTNLQEITRSLAGDKDSLSRAQGAPLLWLGLLMSGVAYAAGRSSIRHGAERYQPKAQEVCAPSSFA